MGLIPNWFLFLFLVSFFFLLDIFRDNFQEKNPGHLYGERFAFSALYTANLFNYYFVLYTIYLVWNTAMNIALNISTGFVLTMFLIKERRWGGGDFQD